MEEQEYIYTSSDGKQYQLHQMNNSYLLNALLKRNHSMLRAKEQGSEQAYEGFRQDVKALEGEVLRRMPIQ